MSFEPSQSTMYLKVCPLPEQLENDFELPVGFSHIRLVRWMLSCLRFTEILHKLNFCKFLMYLGKIWLAYSRWRLFFDWKCWSGKFSRNGEIGPEFVKFAQILNLKGSSLWDD